MTVRASFRASAVVPPRRLSMARASVWTVIMFRTSLHVYLGLRRPYTFAGLSPHSPEPDGGGGGGGGGGGWPPRHVFLLESDYGGTPFKGSHARRRVGMS